MIDVHIVIFAVGRSGEQKGFFNRTDFTFDVDDEQQYGVFQAAMAQAGQEMGALAAASGGSEKNKPNRPG